MTTRLKEILDASGLSAATVARAAGMDQSTFSKLVAGRRRMATHWAQRLAPILKVGPSDFFADPGSPILKTIRPDYQERQDDDQLARLDALADNEQAGGERGDIEFLKSISYPHATVHGEFLVFRADTSEIDRPPGLSTYQSVDATRCRSDNMAPKFVPGDVIFYEFGGAISPGDYVLVRLGQNADRYGRVVIYQFLDKSPDGNYTLKQFNPPEIITLKDDPPLRLRRILPLEELLGIP